MAYPCVDKKNVSHRHAAVLTTKRSRVLQLDKRLRGHALNRRHAARVPTNSQVASRIEGFLSTSGRFVSRGNESTMKWSVPNLRSGSGGDSRPVHKVPS